MVGLSSRISVPNPPARPGQSPNFSHISLPKAGSLPRPPVHIEAQAVLSYAFDLVRVLDDDGQAQGEWAPDLDAHALVGGLKTMMLTRQYDDRMLKMQRTKRLSFYMKSLGEEAVSIAAAMAHRADDMFFPSYRQQGALIQRGGDLVDLMCQCIGNVGDNLLGRQLPVHYARKDLHWFSVSGNLGTQFPQAVGWAMASALRGEDRIAASWIGDGTTAEGDVHSACVLASTYTAPVILNVVNNQWAISMHNRISRGNAVTFASRAIGYGMPGLRVDGNDFLAVYAATQWAAARARAGYGPTLIESYTYRGEAHSTSDDPSRYRPKDEWKSWPLGCPVDRLKQHVIGLGAWSEGEHADWDAHCRELVSRAWKTAIGRGTLEEGPHAPTATMFEDVLSHPDWRMARQWGDLATGRGDGEGR